MLHPFDWNVVVVGRWNRAIYTPQGIVTRLFGQPPGIEFQMEVPADTIGPYRVHFDELMILVDWSRLVVEIPANDYDGLQRAMGVAVRAMQDLPETPLSASGFNIRYKTEEGETGPQAVFEALRHDWDNRLAAANCDVSLRALSRGTTWRNGRVLFSCLEKRGNLTVELNFERKGARGELLEWLQVSGDSIRGQVEHVLSRIVGLPLEELR